MGGKTHDLAGLLPVAKAVSSKERGAVEGGSCLERRQMMHTMNLQPPAMEAKGTVGSAGVEVEEPRGKG